MKNKDARHRLIKILFLLSVALISGVFFFCSSDTSQKALQEGERLVGVYPDSARRILKALDTAVLNEDEKMLRRLLLLEASDKMFETQPDDKEISALVTYFIEGNRLKRIHPVVYYYAGRVYSDLGEDATALGFFKKALKSVGKGKDTDLEGRIHSQLSYLYFEHRLYNYSGRHIKEAIRLSEEENDTVNIIGGKLYLADVYIRREEPDSAEWIYDGLKNMARECSDSITKTTYYTQLAIFYYYAGRMEEADSIISNTSLKYDKVSRTSVLCIKNKIDRGCHGKGIDEDFYRSLLKDTEPGVRFMAAKYLAKGAEARGDAKEMLEYTQLAFSYMKEAQSKFNSSSIAEMEKMMEETDLENDNLQLTLDNKRKQMIILLIVALMIIIAGVDALFIIRGRMRSIALALELEKLKTENHQKIEALEGEIRKLREEGSRPDEGEGEDRTAQLEAGLRLAREKERIVSLLMGAGEKVGEEDFVRLRDAFLQSHPTFIEGIDRMGLRTKDYQDALLVRIDVPQKVCASFFGVTPSALVNSRKRLLRKWAPEGNFKNWKEYLDTL